METPKITITGKAKTGKTALAHAIKQALEICGAEVEITGCEDDVPGVAEKNWQQRIKCLKGQKIIIETVRANRTS